MEPPYGDDKTDFETGTRRDFFVFLVSFTLALRGNFAKSSPLSPSFQPGRLQEGRGERALQDEELQRGAAEIFRGDQ